MTNRILIRYTCNKVDLLICPRTDQNSILSIRIQHFLISVIVLVNSSNEMKQAQSHTFDIVVAMAPKGPLQKIKFAFIQRRLSGLTGPNCLQLLPPIGSTGGTSGYKQQQKVAIGDQEGVLQVFSMKKDELQMHFKTLPSERIASVKLGGQSGSVADKIFTASENKVRGFNKKGKLFLAFETNLTETIRSMCVNGSDLLVCGNHVYNHYRDCKEIGSYLCGDVIVDVAALCPNNTSRLITVLACSGRVLRVLEHSRVRQTLELDSVPTVLYVPKGIAINESTIPSLIKLIEPKIMHYNRLTKDCQMAQALVDLDIRDESEFKMLSKEYQKLIRNQQFIDEEFRKQPTVLNRIYGILTDLYIDKFKFKGVNVKAKLPLLIDLLENYSYDELVRFYTAEKAEEGANKD
ncbi:hypothetical protein AND_000445 [Anopheles darlingi]|uniref:Bardet-Biedl syndrome 7 protein n=1 Tax=Anopheles darlingi TaxID=43151 RepID=W5JX09_ANODA|nr:hypothetical protein AND_000445 [Anopheles darlingi]